MILDTSPALLSTGSMEPEASSRTRHPVQLESGRGSGTPACERPSHCATGGATGRASERSPGSAGAVSEMLRRRIGSALVERALLFDVERVQIETVALLSAQGPWPCSVVDEARVDQAMAVAIDHVQRSSAAPSASLARLARHSNLDPLALARACVRFATLGERERRAFFLLVLEARALPDVAARLGLSTGEPVPLASRALAALLEPASASLRS